MMTENSPDEDEARLLAEGAVTNQELISLLMAERKRQKLGQREIARRMGTTQSVISELERGVSDAKASALRGYARALGLQTKVFLVPLEDE